MNIDPQPLVSVLMTAYNREKYISYAIDSVLSSSYNNFELIIVDDRSSDRTVEIATKYASIDSRIRVYVNDLNLGDYPNRNKAASYAKGKYLKYVDADDYIYPWGLDMLVRMMESNPSAGWGLCSLMQIKSAPYPVLLNPYEAYRHAYFGSGLFHKAPLSSIIKTEVFNAVSGFSSMRMVGDFEMWHRLALEFPVLLMPDGIVWYREHDAQEVNEKDKFNLNYHKITIDYLNHTKCPLTKEEINLLFKQKRRGILRTMISCLLKLRITSFIEEVKLLYHYSI